MNLTEKLSSIQTEIKAPKNLYNSFGKYKYRNAEGICEAVKPFLKTNNCALILEDEMVMVGDRIYVKATASLLDSESNDVIDAVAYARESQDKKGMDDSQITGTASSYARKYALNGLFLLDDTKDADSDEYHEQTTQESQNGQKQALKPNTSTSSKSKEKPQDAPQNAPQDASQTDEKACIDKAASIALHKRCDGKVDAAKLMAMYKVEDFTKLTYKQLNHINANWDALVGMCPLGGDK